MAAADVAGPDGRVLLAGGAALTQDVIDVLRRRGVAHVFVESEPQAEAAVLDAGAAPDQMQACAEVLSRFFLYADPGHPAVQEIFRLVLERAAAAAAAGRPLPEDRPERPNTELLEFDDFLRGDGSPPDLVKKEVRLCTLPAVHQHIMDTLNSSTSTVSVIADVIGKDPGLSARLLRLVNSAFFGFPSKVDTISRAVMIIGVAELSMLAVGVSTIEAFKGVPRELVDMKSFWKHSIACGLLAGDIARRMTGLSPERCFVGGLLHDIGRLVLFRRLPRASTHALLYARENGLPLFEAEKDVFGFDHARIGGMLLTEWNYPPNLVNIVAYHHNPAAASVILEPAVIHLADALAVSLDIARGDVRSFPGVHPEAWKAMDAAPDSLGPLIAEAEAKLDEIVSIFLDEEAAPGGR